MSYIKFNPSNPDHRNLTLNWKCLYSECGHEFKSSMHGYRKEDRWVWCPKCGASARVRCDALVDGDGREDDRLLQMLRSMRRFCVDVKHALVEHADRRPDSRGCWPPMTKLYRDAVTEIAALDEHLGTGDS